MKAYKTEMLVLGSVVMAAAGQTLLKLGLMGHGIVSTLVVKTIPVGVLGGLIIYGLGTLMWIAAVRQRSISYLYPLAGINYVLMAFIGRFLLHEDMGPLRWSGILVMMIGFLLLSRTAEQESGA